MRHDRLMSALRRSYLPWLVGLTFVLLICVIAMIWLSSSIAERNGLHSNLAMLTACGLGALGGTLSSVIKLRDIAELNPFRTVVIFLFVQTIVGAALGFVSWLILTSGMLAVGSTGPTWAVSALVAFVAGFSEPFVFGVLGKVMGLAR